MPNFLLLWHHCDFPRYWKAACWALAAYPILKSTCPQRATKPPDQWLHFQDPIDSWPVEHFSCMLWWLLRAALSAWRFGPCACKPIHIDCRCRLLFEWIQSHVPRLLLCESKQLTGWRCGRKNKCGNKPYLWIGNLYAKCLHSYLVEIRKRKVRFYFDGRVEFCHCLVNALLVQHDFTMVVECVGWIWELSL